MYRTLISVIARHAKQVRLSEEEIFKPITGGQANQTFRLRDAEARNDGQPIAYYICWCLNGMVQPHHCTNMLRGGSIPWPNALCGVLWITRCLIISYGLWRWPIVTITAMAAFLTITATLCELLANCYGVRGGTADDVMAEIAKMTPADVRLLRELAQNMQTRKRIWHVLIYLGSIATAFAYYVRAFLQWRH